MEYDLGGKGRICDTIKIEDESHRQLIDAFLERVDELNEFLHEAFERGDVIDVCGMFGNRSDGPYLGVEIQKVTNGFWKQENENA